MFNVCYSCGEYRPDKVIDPAGPYAICPLCGFKHAFLRLPLLVIAGPAAVGKSTIHRRLVSTVSAAVLLDADILWRPEFNTPESNYRDFFETWLRICKNIAQTGRPVALFCSGAIPENLDPCVERRYFSDLFYLALVCEDGVLEQRLRARPAWRGSAEPAFIEAQLGFNRWFKTHAVGAQPRLELLDTTELSVAAATDRVAQWIAGKLGIDAELDASHQDGNDDRQAV